jgi:surface antigen
MSGCVGRRGMTGCRAWWIASDGVRRCGPTLGSLIGRRGQCWNVCGGVARGSRPVEVAILLATQFRWKSGGRILSLALLGGMTLSPLTSDPARAAQATQAPTAQTWLSIQGTWLCRTWTGSQAATTTGLSAHTTQGQTWQTGTGWFGLSDPATRTTVHCTQRWQINEDGLLTSEMSAWVPDPTGEVPPSSSDPDLMLYHQKPVQQTATTAKPVTQKATLMKPKVTVKKATTVNSAAPVANTGAHDPWAAVPGHPSYAMSDFKGDAYSNYYGVCTWYAWYRHQSEPLMRMGNAESWPANAGGFGLKVGSTPVVGATVIFQPGVEGAGGGGHAGHVEQVLGSGWFIISEMNFSWNGGGWGHVDWRFVYVRSGVSFIY